MYAMGSTRYNPNCRDRYGIGAALQRARMRGPLRPARGGGKGGCATWCHNLMHMYPHMGFPEWQDCYDRCRFIKQRVIIP
jgi:hypothetical protein